MLRHQREVRGAVVEQLLSDMGFKLAPAKALCDSQYAIYEESSELTGVGAYRSALSQGSSALRVRCEGHWLTAFTSGMVAKCLTKPLGFKKFQEILERMGL